MDIDITNLVEAMRSTFVKAGVDAFFLAMASNPATAWMNAPIVRWFFAYFIKKLLDVISKATVMKAFFINTAIRNVSNAVDYEKAVERLRSLPPETSKEEYRKAEQDEISAFNSFVILT